MAINFNNNFNNNGLLTDARFFLADDKNSKDDIANSILSGLGGNKEAGFDFKSIVDLSVTQRMGNKIESIQSQITNTNIRTDALSSLMDSYQQFQRDVLSPFSMDSSLNGVQASSTNTQAADVAISPGATVSSGVSHSVSIQNLAQAESLSSTHFSSSDELLGEGTLSIDLGSYDGAGNFTSNGEGGGLTVKVELGMTVNDLANEINANSRDVKARVITDENGARLALFSQVTGKDQALNVNVTAVNDPGNAALQSLAYSRNAPGTMVLGNEAKDANYTVDGVTFTSSENSVEDVFGFDLNFKEATGSTFNISTSANNDGVLGNVEAFVYNYNSLIEELNNYTSDMPGEDGQGSLFREEVVGDIERELYNLQRNITANVSEFSTIGISFNGDQELQIDYDRLNSALASDPHAVRKAFADDLSSSNPNLQVLEYGDNRDDILTGYTQDGTYSVEVTQAATQATMTGADMGGPVTVAAGGHDLIMQVNGREVSINFAEGEYTSQQVASRISEEISRQSGSDYTVTDNAGSLTITSGKYGSSQSVEVTQGGALFGLSGISEGTDIQGRINGKSAAGDGTTLTAILTDDAKGLSVNVSGNQVGVLGDVTVTRGALSHFGNSIEKLSGKEGIMFEAYRDYMAELDESNRDSLIADLEAAREREAQLRNQFNAKFTASQQAIAAMQNNLNMVKAYFGSDDD